MISRFARPYAQALVRTAGSTEQAVAVRDELRRVADLMAKTPAFHKLASNPGVPKATKVRLLDQIADALAVGKLGRTFLHLLLQNYRLVRLPEILGAVDDLLNRRLGIVHAEVTTAEALAPAQQQRLEAALRAKLGADVQLRVGVDPKLVAGFVARVQSTRYDASLRGQLDRLARQLAGA